MANNETTTKFKVDISELKQAMQEAKRQISVANSEFKEVSSSMDDWSKSSDGISAKLKQLGSNLKSQKTILKSLEAQYDALTDEQKQGSKAADDLKIKINNQKAAINKTEREISNFEDALKEVEKAEKKAALTGRDVADVLDDMDKKAESAGDGFTVFKGAVATFAGNALTSLVSGLAEAAKSVLELADETREYRTEMGKLETAFTTAGHTTETATGTYKDLYAVLGDEGQAVEASNMLAKLCKTEEELADWTNIATGVYGTFGSSLPIESLTEAANETSKTGAITGSLADALNWAGVSEDDFQKKLDGCSNEQERQALITETLNGLYSDAAKKYEETNKSVMDANRANSDYTDTLAAMGEKVEPVTTSLKEGFNLLLQEVLKLVEDVDMEAFTAKIEEAFKFIADEVLPAVKEGFQWILDHKDLIIAGIAGIAAAFLAFKVVSIIQGVISALNGMTIAQYALNLAMSLNPIGIVIALIAGLVAAFVVLWKRSEAFRNFWIGIWEAIKAVFEPIIKGIVKFFTETVPAAIDTMITFFKELPTKIWTWLTNALAKVATWAANMRQKAKDTAVNFLNTVISFIKQLPSKIWTWLVNVVSKVLAWRSNMIAKAKEAALSFINKVIEYIKQLPSKIWTWLTNAASKVVSWGSSLASKGKAAAQKLFTAVIDKIKEIPSKILSVGKDIVTGLWNGINDKVQWLKDKISGFVGNVKDWLKKFFKIGSPSKLMADEIGKWIPEGIAVGIDKNAKSVLSSMKNLAVNTVGAARDGLTSASNSVGGSTGIINNYTQVINSPKALSRLDIYRQSKNLLGLAGGGA